MPILKWAMVLAWAVVPCPGAGDPQPAAADAGQRLVTGGNRFAFDLYRAAREPAGNLCFSPCSVSVGLAMAWAGARSTTAAEMAATLHLDPPGPETHAAFAAALARLNQPPDKPGGELLTASALWAASEEILRPAYRDLLKTAYAGESRNLDFAGDPEGARHAINGWAEEKTRRRIVDLVPPGMLDRSTLLVLTNAIWFKGTWASQFRADRTRNETFTGARGGPATVPMMHQVGRFGYAEEEGLQVLQLPYAGDRWAMLILLPATADGLAGLEPRLTPENLSRWTAALVESRVDVALPRITIACPLRLDEPLKSLGMREAFTDRADFSGMLADGTASVGAVIHKAFVQIDEQGTEAAAATAVSMIRVAAEVVPRFQADHPFIFLIRETASGAILFIGRIQDVAG